MLNKFAQDDFGELFCTECGDRPLFCKCAENKLKSLFGRKEELDRKPYWIPSWEDQTQEGICQRIERKPRAALSKALPILQARHQKELEEARREIGKWLDYWMEIGKDGSHNWYELQRGIFRLQEGKEIGESPHPEMQGWQSLIEG